MLERALGRLVDLDVPPVLEAMWAMPTRVPGSPLTVAVEPSEHAPAEPAGAGEPAWIAAMRAHTTAAAGSGRGPAAGLAVLAQVDRMQAYVDAQKFRALVTLVGAVSTGSSETERQKAHEIAIASRVSIATAARHIARARLMAGPFACFLDALEAGQVSMNHCLVLLEGCTNVSDDAAVLTQVAAKALPFAQRLYPADLRDHIAALVARLDPDATARRTRAKETRRVYTRTGQDGMAFLGFVHDAEVIDAVFAQIVSEGRLLQTSRRAGPDATPDQVADTAAQIDAEHDAEHNATATTAPACDDADLDADACRADAFAARILGEVADDGSITWDRPASTMVTVEVVIDLDTLRGLRDGVTRINGRPAPADIGRDLAQWGQWIRRIVVDPVEGYLLDYGDRTYLPPALRRHCFARDDGCRSPGCTRRAPRLLQLDHAEEFPHGPSSTSNAGALCGDCHQRKTSRLLDITDSHADGSATFTTAWGQVVHVPPRAYLADRLTEPDPQIPSPPLEEPPF